MQSSVLLQLAKLWLFLFFQQIPNPQNWWVLIGQWWAWLLSQQCVCCSLSFPTFTRWSASAISLLEICLSWHYKILHFVGQTCLDKHLHKRDWSEVRYHWICPIRVGVHLFIKIWISLCRLFPMWRHISRGVNRSHSRFLLGFFSIFFRMFNRDKLKYGLSLFRDAKTVNPHKKSLWGFTKQRIRDGEMQTSVIIVKYF